MNQLIKLLAVAVITSFGVSQANAIPIVNGGFEDLGSGNSFQYGSWGLFSSIPGWTPAPNTPQIEIGTGGTYGVTGFQGNNVMELDSTANVTVQQIVGTPNGSYTLSFLYAARVNLSGTTTTFSVFWNGVLVDTFTPDPNDQSMNLYSTTVIGIDDATHNTLSFVGTGASDSYGAIIDDVQLTQAPDGGTTLALLGMSLTGLAFFRRKLV